MKLLVTGAAGFIGSAFIRRVLRERDVQVVAFIRNNDQRNLLRLSTVRETFSLDTFRMVFGDLCDPGAVSGICEGIDVVVHFAAKTFVDHSIVDPTPFIQSNIVGTFNLLEQARRYHVRRFMMVSTDEVYGAILRGAHTEQSPLNPSNPYASSKAAAEMLALSYWNTYKLPVIVTRTENNYGPWQHRQKALPVFVRTALADEPLPVYGDGLHSRMWLHVDDHCDAIRMLMDDGVGEPGQIYHVAGQQELTNIELARMVLRICRKSEDQIAHIDDHDIRPGHDRRYALAAEKLRVLGWSPKIELEPGIASAVDWYMRNTWWLS